MAALGKSTFVPSAVADRALLAAWAGVPFVPVNYRLETNQLNALIARQPDAVVLADESTSRRAFGGTHRTALCIANYAR